MRIVIDIECNRLHSPDKIWVICTKCVETGERRTFRNLTDDPAQEIEFKAYAQTITQWIGHNVLAYDIPVLSRLLGIHIPVDKVVDTLIISKLVNYSRVGGHSIEQYGEEFGLEKMDVGKAVAGHNPFFNQWSQKMEDYCARDVEICHRVFDSYSRCINAPDWASAIRLEQRFQLIVNDLHDNGFGFDVHGARSLLSRVQEELDQLDERILQAFPPREILIREFTPKATKFGTINRASVPRSLHSRIQEYEVGRLYRYTKLEPFNPSSHKQLIGVLNEAGWKPEDKTQTHVDTERAIGMAKRNRNRDVLDSDGTDILRAKLAALQITGWKINEQNLGTLPDTAPEPARLLANRIMLESRRRTLTEWINLTCLEIKINKESISLDGIEKNVKKTQSGGMNKTQRDVLEVKDYTNNETLKNTECLTCTIHPLTIINKKSVNEDTISRNVTDLRSKTLIEWLKNRKVNVKSAKENASWLWITVINPVKSEDYSVSDVMHVLDGLKANGLVYTITSSRIFGEFYGIGAWTGRMAHQRPNTANIPNAVKISDGSPRLLGKEMRQLWCAPKKRLLVGVDAEAIQFRIFAHMIDDPTLINAILNGKKSDKTDPHSINQIAFGSMCKTRNASKHSMFALFFGGRANKISHIMGCTKAEAEQAIKNLLKKYPGLEHLEKKVFPADARRGYFIGIDGRHVPIPDETQSGRQHLCMSGYLQNGEAIIMKKAAIIMDEKLSEYKDKGWWQFVDIIHDEIQSEVRGSLDFAKRIANIKAEAIKEAGEYYNLKCPMAGSYWNDDAKTYTIGQNWYTTH